jgi:hypothetical protein
MSQTQPKPPFLFKIHFNIILQSTPGLSIGPSSSRLPTKPCMYPCYMPRPSDPWFVHRNDIWWPVQIIRLLNWPSALLRLTFYKNLLGRLCLVASLLALCDVTSLRSKDSIGKSETSIETVQLARRRQGFSRCLYWTLFGVVLLTTLNSICAACLHNIQHVWLTRSRQTTSLNAFSG